MSGRNTPPRTRQDGESPIPAVGEVRSLVRTRRHGRTRRNDTRCARVRVASLRTPTEDIGPLQDLATDWKLIINSRFCSWATFVSSS